MSTLVLDGLDLPEDDQTQNRNHIQKVETESQTVQKRMEKELDKALLKDKRNKKSEEEIREHRQLVKKLIKISRSKLLKEILNDYKYDLSRKKLQKLPLEELQELHDEVMEVITSDDQSDWIANLTLTGIEWTEAILYNAVGPQANIIGLADMLRQNKQFLTSLEILQLEHSDTTDMSAAQRVMFMIAFAAFQKHQANKVLDKLMPSNPETSEQNVPQEENVSEAREELDVREFKRKDA